MTNRNKDGCRRERQRHTNSVCFTLDAIEYFYTNSPKLIGSLRHVTVTHRSVKKSATIFRAGYFITHEHGFPFLIRHFYKNSSYSRVSFTITKELNCFLPLSEHFSSTNALGRDMDFNSPATEINAQGKKEC